jgi:hypothetical protein
VGRVAWRTKTSVIEMIAEHLPTVKTDQNGFLVRVALETKRITVVSLLQTEHEIVRPLFAMWIVTRGTGH